MNTQLTICCDLVLGGCKAQRGEGKLLKGVRVGDGGVSTGKFKLLRQSLKDKL